MRRRVDGNLSIQGDRIELSYLMGGKVWIKCSVACLLLRPTAMARERTSNSSRGGWEIEKAIYSPFGFLMGFPCSSTSPFVRITLRASWRGSSSGFGAWCEPKYVSAQVKYWP